MKTKEAIISKQTAFQTLSKLREHSFGLNLLEMTVGLLGPKHMGKTASAVHRIFITGRPDTFSCCVPVTLTKTHLVSTLGD
jgi:hypothetical protein